MSIDPKVLSEEELEGRIKDLYREESTKLTDPESPKRVLFTEIARRLNEEGIITHQEKEWTWQKVHSFVGRHPQVEEP